MSHSRVAIPLLLWAVLVGGLVTDRAQATTPAQSDKPVLTFEQVFLDAEPHLIRPLPLVIGWADERHFLLAGGTEPGIRRVEAVTGHESPADARAECRELAGEEVNLDRPEDQSADRTRFLYRLPDGLYGLDTAARTFRRLTDAAETLNPTLSPSGDRVAFTRAGDLYTLAWAGGLERRHTHDGGGAILNGRASWVYYEEILGRRLRYRAFWWSPDSRWLAFFRFDDSEVPLYPLYNDSGQHGTVEWARYPKAGDPNPKVKLGLLDTDTGSRQWLEFPFDPDSYFGTPFWTPDGQELFVQWMNRGQDRLEVHAISPTSPNRRLVFTETQATWVDWLDEIHFLADGGFVVCRDVDGWAHLYRHGRDGSLRQRLTAGPWEVVRLEAVDDTTVWFTARREDSTRVDLYRAPLAGGEPTRLTFGSWSHRVQVAPGGGWFVTTWSNLSTPPRMTLCDGHGQVVRELGDARTPAFDDHRLGRTELFRVPSGDGFDLPVAWTLPPDFDPARTYPVLVSVYGGPAARSVDDTWRGMGNQWLAVEGLIQVSLDHRGSGHFGKAGTALMHRQLGHWEMHDYAAAVRWLTDQPFVDPKRVAITGGSYGGYVAALALARGNVGFTHGVSLYPVVDWRLYDTHYTERYMDHPTENPDGYRAGSVLEAATGYRGLLRLVHGTLDDNVHPQNTLQLAGRLQDLGAEFEMMLYPGGRHGWGGARGTHLRIDSHRFHYRHLLRRPFPENLYRKLAGARPPGRR